MKKFNLIIVAALAMVGWSCADEHSNVPLPSNPQEPIMTGADLTVSAAIPATINLIQANAADEAITLGTVTEVKNLPAGYTLQWVGSIGREEEYVHTADFAVTADENGVLTATADDLEAAYVAAMGKSAKAKKAYLRVAAYAVNGASQVRMGGADVYYVNGTSTITPFDLGIVIEDSYGLLGTINGWSVANAVPFDHTGDPYDNPIFTMIVSISDAEADGGWWWKVVPASTIATGNWVDAANASFGTAVNGSHDLEGNLVPRTDTEDCGAGCVNVGGVYRLELDMENQTYQFVSLYSFLWTPGDANGWNHMNAGKLFAEIGKTEYQGLVKLQGSYKFTDVAGWNGTNYGNSGTDGTLSDDSGAGNLSVASAGTYWAKVNTEKLTYQVAKIESLGLIGGFNGWGAQEALTSTDGLVWTGTITLSAGDEFKIRMNDNWDINLGGDVNNLTFGGANIKAPAAGTYNVTLDITKIPYTLKLVK